MICTIVILFFSSDLAKNNKIMSTFVLFSWGFLPFCLAFFKFGGTNLTPKQSNRIFSVNFSKVQQK